MDTETEARIVVVEVVIVHDGVTDLPSASEHMKRRMRNGHCRIPVGHGGSLKPDPRSVNVEHKFAHHGATTPRMVYYTYPGNDQVMFCAEICSQAIGLKTGCKTKKCGSVLGLE